MARSSKAFQERITRGLLREAKRQAHKSMTRLGVSRTLRKALVSELRGPGRGRLFIPHYWAVMVHDGRSAIAASRTRFLVFFRRPRRDDPRIGANFPVRLREVGRLDHNSFMKGLLANARAKRAGRPPVMFFSRSVGPVQAKRFFDNRFGMRRFLATAKKEIPPEFSKFVRDILPTKEQINRDVKAKGPAFATIRARTFFRLG